MARPMKATLWYEGSDGRMWHVEVGSKAEARLVMDGAEAIADPNAAAPEPEKKPEPKKEKQDKPKDKKPEPEKKPEPDEKKEK